MALAEVDDLAAIFFGANPARGNPAPAGEVSQRESETYPCESCESCESPASMRAAARFATCECLRKVANPGPATTDPSQTFAEIRSHSQSLNRAAAQQIRGSSQNSQDSQGSTAKTTATTATPITTTGPAPALLALLAGDQPAVDPDRWCWPHSDAMNGAEIARFIGRVKRAVGRGIPEAEAERLADELVLADRRPSSVPAPAPPARPAARSCSACANLLPRGTCAEPVGAGLDESFGIAWPEHGRGADCAAFQITTERTTR